MKILLADDHTLVREGLRHVLCRLDSEVVVVEAMDGDQALEMARAHADLDIVLLDIAMPGMNGLEGLVRLRACLPSTPIVMLSAAEEAPIVHEALQRGAQGFIPKSSTGDVMIGALRLVLAGGVYLPPALLRRPEPDSSRAPRTAYAPPTCDADLGLTQRQREVLVLIMRGSTNKDIARLLNMSETTVRTHATAIFRVLNVTNRTQAGHVAATRGFSQAADQGNSD